MITKVKIAVCDDEKIILEIVENKLRKTLAKMDFPDYEILLFESGLELLQSREPFHLILLDIEMPGVNGLSLAKRLNEFELRPFIILITSHAELMPWGFHVNAFRYLTKPLTDQTFDEAITSAMNEILSVEMIVIEHSGKNVLVDLKEILYIEALGEGCCIYTGSSKYIGKEPLKYWITHFPGGDFIQTHRAFIINLRHVNDIRANLVCMKNGSEIPVSVRKRKALTDALHGYVRRKSRK